MTKLSLNNRCTDKNEGVCEKEWGLGSYNLSVYWDFFLFFKCILFDTFFKKGGGGVVATS